MLPKSKEVKERILQGFDRSYYDAIHSQMAYAFGEKWGSKHGYIDGGYEDLPIYPDIKTTILPVGQSRRILNYSMRTLSRVLSRLPRPKSPQVDEVTDEVRAQFWLNCARGERGVPAKWLKHLQYAFVEGDTLGVGAVRHGLTDHPYTGLQLTEMVHVPILQCYWDAFESDPRNSRWVAVATYIPFDQAEAEFGKKAKDHKISWTVNSEGREAEFVRVIEYWDIGIGGNEPAYCRFIGTLDNGEVEPNEFGIPVSFCVNFIAPGMRRPIGRAVMQMSTQELINDIERYMRQTMKRGPAVDTYDAGAFDPASLNRWKAGDASQGLEMLEGFNEDVGKIFKRHAGMEIPQGVLALFGIAERQYNDDSNQTEQSRGNALGSRTTAREVMNLQARAAESAGLTDQQANEFLQDAIAGTFDMALIGDTHPIPLDIFGRNVTFNDPREPMSSIKRFLEEPSSVIVDVATMTTADDDLKKQTRIQELMAIQPLVGINVNPDKYRDELLEAIGERNLEEWRLDQAVLPTQAKEQ